MFFDCIAHLEKFFNSFLRVMYTNDLTRHSILVYHLQIVEPEEVTKKTALGYLHTTHCLGSGEVMISAMGTPEGNEEGT